MNCSEMRSREVAKGNKKMRFLAEKEFEIRVYAWDDMKRSTDRD